MLAATGPVVVAQEVMPATPVILQLPTPLGARAFVGPLTVALKEMVEPRVAELAVAKTLTVGATGLTVVVEPELGPVPK